MGKDIIRRFHILIHLAIVIKSRMTLTRVQTAREWHRQLSNQSVIRYAQIPKFECKPYKVGNEIRSMDSTIDEDCSENVGMISRAVECRL